MDKELLTRIRQALLSSWSPNTCDIFTKAMHSSYGQCAQTAIVVQEHFGGEILQTSGWPPNGRHFYNRVDGERLDFTAEQFSCNPQYQLQISYADTPSNAFEAQTEASPIQIATMRSAFSLALQGQDERRHLLQARRNETSPPRLDE